MDTLGPQNQCLYHASFWFDYRLHIWCRAGQGGKTQSSTKKKITPSRSASISRYHVWRQMTSSVSLALSSLLRPDLYRAGHNIQRLQVQGVLWSRQDENNGREILFSLGRTASQKTEVWDILAGRSRRSWPRQNLHHCSEPCWWNNNIFNLLR